MKDILHCLIYVAVVGGVSLWVSAERCDAKTKGLINMPSKWSVFGGCQIQTPQGWIPLENYRTIQ